MPAGRGVAVSIREFGVGIVIRLPDRSLVPLAPLLIRVAVQPAILFRSSVVADVVPVRAQAPAGPDRAIAVHRPLLVPAVAGAVVALPLIVDDQEVGCGFILQPDIDDLICVLS